jgi:hypothetical protein
MSAYLGERRSIRNRLQQVAATPRARLTCASYDDETSLILCDLCGAFCASSIFMYHDACYCTATCRRHATAAKPQPPRLRAGDSVDSVGAVDLRRGGLEDQLAGGESDLSDS